MEAWLRWVVVFRPVNLATPVVEKRAEVFADVVATRLFVIPAESVPVVAKELESLGDFLPSFDFLGAPNGCRASAEP